MFVPYFCMKTIKVYQPCSWDQALKSGRGYEICDFWSPSWLLVPRYAKVCLTDSCHSKPVWLLFTVEHKRRYCDTQILNFFLWAKTFFKIQVWKEPCSSWHNSVKIFVAVNYPFKGYMPDHFVRGLVNWRDESDCNNVEPS